MQELVVKSPAFDNNKTIPKKYTCDGDNVNPTLTIEGIPKEAKSLVLIIDDPDSPFGTFGHWVVWNISPTNKIEENSSPGTQGLNDFGKHNYGGPCPQYGTHRYFFKVYALDTELDLNINLRRGGVEKAIKDHIIAEGKLVGLYGRK